MATEESFFFFVFLRGCSYCYIVHNLVNNSTPMHIQVKFKFIGRFVCLGVVLFLKYGLTMEDYGLTKEGSQGDGAWPLILAEADRFCEFQASQVWRPCLKQINKHTKYIKVQRSVLEEGGFQREE